MATIFATTSVKATTSKYATTSVYSNGTVINSNTNSGTNFVFGSAISTASPHYSTITHPLAQQSILSEITVRVPTNSWWTNLYMGTNRIVTDPYHIKPVTQGLYICNPSFAVSSNNIVTSFIQNIAFEASETLTIKKIESFTDLGVVFRWSDGTNTLKSYFTRGMAYNTMVYTNLTPKITTAHAILSVNGSSSTGDVTGTKFKIILNNGQTWILYASQSLTLNWQNSTGWRMLASQAYTGTLQLAYLASAGYEATLDTYALSYARGGTVGATVSGDTSTISFNWDVVGSTLLQFAYPHHMDCLNSPNTTSLSYTSIIGNMTGITGNTWTINEALTNYGWDGPRAIDADKVSAITTALSSDKTYTSTTPNDPYFGGKEYAKIGRLISIAEHSQINDTAAAATLRASAKTALEPWINASNSNAIKYDTTWGGINTTNGLASSNNDFGAGYYNDHHFHWGYHVYCAAAIAKNDSTWLAANQDKVNVYLRDIMNPSDTDTYFPRFRHFDWFAGHSWAAGLFDFGDNRNQESTSEAINAWYACYLWGVVTNNANIRDHARILLAMELRSSKKYWQRYTGNDMYSASMTGNGIGVVWSSKVDDTTFFGSNIEYRRGIQIVPILPITESLVPSAWANAFYTNEIAATVGAMAAGWQNFMYAAQATFDKTTAWTNATSLSGFDGGNSKTNQLYWGATRP